jgi:hypothetical protein
MVPYGAPYGRRLTIALVVALVVIVAAGAGLAYLVGRDRGIEGLAKAGGTPPAGSASTTVTTPTAADATSATTAVEPAGSTSGSEDADGPVDVTLSPSAEAAPQARDVTDLIVRYFNAINRHDYDAWLTTVTTAQARRDRDSWTTDYSTTRDSDIYISDITQGDPLTVRMQFVSHQALSFAPAELPAECVRWDVTYQILDEGVGLRVGTSAKAPAMAPC